ncbi:MAG TPA: thiamine-phosphate kinase [Chitinispirillaceae bacterium]|nr:thiamine-phosphate kinase [Chitinispirillaceae bacterium]
MRKKFPSGEYELLAELKNIINIKNSAWETGIGDDAAVRLCDNEKLIFTADTSVENTHFDLNTMCMEEIGYRAMVSNISDCAAMGAVPDSALIQLVFPNRCKNIKESIINLYNGFSEACKEWKFSVVGGDLSAGNQWVIGITLIGRAPAHVVTRKGIQNGDFLWVSGVPGLSAAGLDALKKWGRKDASKIFPTLVKNHIRPVPQVKLGRILAENQHVHAMMDLSDGLSKDCATLAYENNLGLDLETKNIQIPDTMIQLSKKLGTGWQKWFMHGGEDYHLLYAASPDLNLKEICSEVESLYLGKFTNNHYGVLVYNDVGEYKELSAGSWDHINRTGI